MIKRELYKYLKGEEENYLSLINLVTKLASQNPDINIISRPHPRQSNQILLKKDLVIKIKYKGNL